MVILLAQAVLWKAPRAEFSEDKSDAKPGSRCSTWITIHQRGVIATKSHDYGDGKLFACEELA